MRIFVMSVLVHDQDRALRFYTDVLGFVKKTKIPMGEARLLTAVSPDNPDGVELFLEPDGQAVQTGARRGRDSVHVVWRKRCERRIQASRRRASSIHSASRGHGASRHGCL